MKKLLSLYSLRFILVLLTGFILAVLYQATARAAVPLVDIRAMGSDGPVTRLLLFFQHRSTQLCRISKPVGKW
ncbi:MAG: hypothetical protein U9P10_10075 [Thermodesulfobacteriota bacterium]|nr:hypothetical protein [Thermodesulfobacteriota bacterium]